MSLLIKYQDGGSMKADTTINEGLVTKVPIGYQKDRQEIIGNKIRTYHSIQNKELKTPYRKSYIDPNKTKDPVAYDKLIKDKLSRGATIQDLVNSGLISKNSAVNYEPFQVKREVYTESEMNPAQAATSNLNNLQTVVHGSANAFRREVVEANGNGYKVYSIPDEKGNYTNNAKRVYAVGDKLIDIDKTNWDKNNRIVPHFTGEQLPSEGIVNYTNPSDDMITKPGSEKSNQININRNNFGGNVNTENKTNGKVIETGKMYSPSFKRGGSIDCGCVLYKKIARKYQQGGIMGGKNSVILYGSLTPEIMDSLKTDKGYLKSTDQKLGFKPSKERVKKVQEVYDTMVNYGASHKEAVDNLVRMSGYGSWRDTGGSSWGFDHIDIPEHLQKNRK